MKLFLKIQIGADDYLLDAGRIRCVLPLMNVKPVPHAPPAIAGCFFYEGAMVPVIDLTQLTLGRPAPRHLSTRVILVPFHSRNAARTQQDNLLGLMAENVTETVRSDTKRFAPASVTSDGARHLGSLLPVAGRLLQQIDLSRLLPSELSAMLFHDVDGGPGVC
jgi:chemotaxis-related protein WspB